VIPPSANGAARQATCAQFGVAAGTAPAELDESARLGDVAVDGQDGAGTRLYVDYVIVGTAVFVGVFEGAPP
jgi:hypothetical protein